MCEFFFISIVVFKFKPFIIIGDYLAAIVPSKFFLMLMPIEYLFVASLTLDCRGDVLFLLI